MNKLPWDRLNALLNRIIYQQNNSKNIDEALYWEKHINKLLTIHYGPIPRILG